MVPMARTKTLVIGNENCVLGYGLVGVEGRVVHDAAEMENALDVTLSDDLVAILLISSDVASFARNRVDELKVNSMTPLVVEVPGYHTDDEGMPLKELVQRAVGVKLGGN
jgi:V/A-type H+-transporting ATPase subunit F